MTQQMANLQFLALDLMTYHGLIQQGWKFSWSKRKRVAGLCSYNTRTLEFSTVISLAGSQEDFKDTVLHEIAHALVGSGEGHGPIWKAKAISIGCSGSRTSDVTLPIEHSNWSGVCALGHRVGVSRKPKYIDMENSYTCGKCAPGIKSHIVTWFKKTEVYVDWSK